MKLHFLKKQCIPVFLLLFFSPFYLYAASNCQVQSVGGMTTFDNSGDPHDAVLADVSGDKTQRRFSLPDRVSAHAKGGGYSILEMTPVEGEVYSFTYHMEHTEFYCYVEITTGCHDFYPSPSYLTYEVTKVEAQGSDTGHHRVCSAAFDYAGPSTANLIIKMSGNK